MKMNQCVCGAITGLFLTCAAWASGSFLDGLSAPENAASDDRNPSPYDKSVSDIYRGRSPYYRGETLKPPAASKPAKAAPPAPLNTPAPRPPAGTNSGELNTGLMRVTKNMPAETAIGYEFMYDLRAAALQCAANIVLTDVVPDSATYVRSEPAADVQGNRLVWKFAAMDAGEAKTIRVWLRPDKEGSLASCTTLSADPRLCASTFVGKPVLAIQETGPATVTVGSALTYYITVTNTGNSVAREVVVADAIPQGLTHLSGNQELSFPVGDLQPGQSKTLPVTLKAAQRGKFNNVAVATSRNTAKAVAEASTTVVQPGLKIVQTGDKEQYLHKTATYSIVLSNTGDVPLEDVTVTDVVPEPTKLVSADGASVRGNTAVWRVAQLKPGEEQTFAIKVSSTVGGNYCNAVTASTASGLGGSNQTCTAWKGIAAILIEVMDDHDPIQLGETTTYTVRVTNQGSADLTSIGIVATCPKQVTPVSADRGTVDGQAVNFPSVPRLAPKQSLQYTIKAKGASEGDARVKVEVTAVELQTPVTEEESTRVY